MDLQEVELVQTILSSQLADGTWGQNAQGVNFASLGNVSYTFTGGQDYSSGTGNYTATLGSLLTSYNLFENRDDVAVDFLMMGPKLFYRARITSKSKLTDFYCW